MTMTKPTSKVIQILPEKDGVCIFMLCADGGFWRYTPRKDFLFTEPVPEQWECVLEAPNND